jgi:hypothetical protein
MHCAGHSDALRATAAWPFIAVVSAWSRDVSTRVRSLTLARSLTPCRYNLTLIERLWTSYVSLGLHPVVELSFMPSFLGNCSWHIDPPDCHADEGLPCSAGKGPSCPMLMAYVVPRPPLCVLQNVSVNMFCEYVPYSCSDCLAVLAK